MSHRRRPSSRYLLSSSGVLNVCSPYTSRDETTTAIRDTVQEVYDGTLPLRWVGLLRSSSMLLSDSRLDANTARNLTHSHIYQNLQTCQSIESVASRLEADVGKIDIYVRTSDVRRLSDFQMWQVSLRASGRREWGSGLMTVQASGDTQLHFVKTYWPEFGLTDMLPILLGWQQKMWLRAVGL